MIEVKQNISDKYILSLYEKLYEKESANDRKHLMLPRKMQGTDLGILFQFIQFFATWIRTSNELTLHLPITKETISDYLQEEFVYPCVVLAWEINIVDVNGESIKKELKEPSKEYYKSLELTATQQTGGRAIYCFDHDKVKRGYSRIFYNEKQTLFQENELSLNLYKVFERISKINKKIFLENIKPVYKDFAAIIHELFGNTDEHGKTTIEGYYLYPNIRALYIKFHGNSLKQYQKNYSTNIGLTDYFNSDFGVDVDDDIYFIELSIVDSGPGLIRRYSKSDNKKLDISNEVSIIKQCLTVHNTSNTSELSSIKGLGLHRVMKTLNPKGGLVRIKTSKSDVFRDLKNSPYEDHEALQSIKLFDWEKNKQNQYTSHDWAEGTLISIFYPLSTSI